jgi:hypothetical protein
MVTSGGAAGRLSNYKKIFENFGWLGKPITVRVRRER